MTHDIGCKYKLYIGAATNQRPRFMSHALDPGFGMEPISEGT